MEISGIGIVAFLAAILIVAGIVLVIVVAGKGGKKLDQQRYRSKWLQIESSLHKDQPASYQLAILNADKLLDEALRESGYQGGTMGERLKSAKSVLRNNNAVWTAHKLRNQIAHETDVQVKYDSARRALACFKQGLKDIGAI